MFLEKKYPPQVFRPIFEPTLHYPFKTHKKPTTNSPTPQSLIESIPYNGISDGMSAHNITNEVISVRLNEQRRIFL
jgi:hypothetical protein